MRNVPRGNPDKYVSEQQPPKARWQSTKDILAAKELHYDPKKPNGKICIGAIGDQLIGIKDNRHIETVGGTRSGKTLTVENNLFFYDGSVFLFDPKGTSAMKTAMARAKLGQKVFIIDPFQIVKGEAAKFRASFNVLKRLSTDNPFIIEDTFDIIDGLIITTKQEKDPHWNDTAGEILSAIIWHVCFNDGIKDEERHLGTVRSIAMKLLKWDSENERYIIKAKIESTVKKLEKEGHIHIATALDESMTSFYDKTGSELNSVVSTLRRHLKFLMLPALLNSIKDHDFDPSDLKSNPDGVTIYLVLPATRMALCAGFIRAFVNRTLSDMEREETVSKQPVLMILDELPVLQRMQQLENAAGLIASFHVKMWWILQDRSQGEDIYGKRWDSFSANAGISQYFSNTDVTTTEYISKRLGKTTVLTATSKEASSKNREQGITGKEFKYEQYPLATPDEVSLLFARNDPLKRQCVLLSGYQPMILQRIEHYDPKSPIAKYLPK